MKVCASPNAARRPSTHPLGGPRTERGQTLKTKVYAAAGSILAWAHYAFFLVNLAVPTTDRSAPTRKPRWARYR
jgi:hypothetical protein